MMTDSPPRLPYPAVWGALFALAYTQAPLYYSNQNQYLLHGVAWGGAGNLSDDWLANTLSPTPLFDGIVALAAASVGLWALHLLYAVLQGVYFVSLVSVAARAGGDRLTSRSLSLLAALVLLAHCAALRWASFQLLGLDYPCYLQGWLAAQYVLGPVMQPSVFGVLLVVSLARFLSGRHLEASAWAAAAVTLHTTYALTAGWLVVGYAASLWLADRRRAARVAVTFAFLVAPVVAYSAWTFRPTTPDVFAAAQELLAHGRIPHHADPAVWFDHVTTLQLILIAAGLAAVRNPSLSRVLRTVAAGSVALTGVQIATGSESLALAFPWRSSVILIPLATAILLARVAALPRLDRPLVARLAGVVASVAAAAGVAVVAAGQGYAVETAEAGLLDYVAAHKQPGDVYLLPVRLPHRAARGSGSVSSDFRPPAAEAIKDKLIPADFQRFRLVTRAAIFVGFKAIPYKDVEVLEWQKRVGFASSVYMDADWDGNRRLAQVRGRGVTHVVTTRDRDITSAGLEPLYADGNYTLYRVRP
jgi:hypothetical protein